MSAAALQTTAPQIHRTFEDALLACPQGAYEFEDLVNVVVDKTAAFNDRLQTNRVFDLGALRTLIGIGLAHEASTLRVLDFGGAAGYHHSMAQMAFGQRIALQWNVVETPTMARQASRLASGTLKFFDSLAAAKDDLGSVDLLFASSSLQYCPAPLQTLQELIDVGAKRLFITRTPFFEGEATIVTTQTSRLSDNGPGPLPAGYTDQPMTYPISYVPRRRVEAMLRQRYDICFSVIEDPATLFVGHQAVNPYHGYFCERR